MLASGLTGHGHSVQIKEYYYLWPLQVLYFLQAAFDCVDLVRKHAEQHGTETLTTFGKTYEQNVFETKSFERLSLIQCTFCHIVILKHY